MSAKEMFEKLGYKKRDEYNEIKYSRNIIKEDGKIYYLSEDEEIIFHENNIWFGGKIVLNKKELQAINKQIEELGW